MAAASGFFYDESFVAATSASLVANQFCIVALSTVTTINGRAPIILCPNSSSGVNGGFGILQDTPNVGRAGDVRILGISKLVATTSAAITQGALITSTTAGQGCVADTTGQVVFGRALSGSTALGVGSLIDLLITGPTVFALSS